ncbi:MAG: hypothetical protein WCA19_19635 [Candidatus Acidiferrales bacterium]
MAENAGSLRYASARYIKCGSEADGHGAYIDPNKISADCRRGLGFLAELTDDEQTLARDRYQREQATAETLRAGL